MAGSKELSKWPEFKAVSQLKSIDVISVRLWFDRKIAFKYPANVLAGFENQAGSTFFDLNTLQVFASCLVFSIRRNKEYKLPLIESQNLCVSHCNVFREYPLGFI